MRFTELEGCRACLWALAEATFDCYVPLLVLLTSSQKHWCDTEEVTSNVCL